KVYWYSDGPEDTLSVVKEVIERVRKASDGVLYFTQGRRDAVGVDYKDGGLVIVAAAFDEPGNEKMRHLRLVLSLSFIGGILISVIGGYLFSLSLLHPIRRIADEVNDISARNLARRIRSTGGEDSRDEWDYLSETLNQLLNRLQESFEIQGRFIANASHELSTPLTSISSQLEVALQRVRSLEEYRHVIQSVYQDARQLSKLTQTLLEFARASGTASGLEIDLIRIDEVLLRLPGEIGKAGVSGAGGNFGRTGVVGPGGAEDEVGGGGFVGAGSPASGGRFEVTLNFDGLPEAEESLLVFGNEELLFTAIRNVVVNACKYSDDHRAVVRLAVQGREIRISVEDRGRGIAPEETERIFQPFYRTEEGHTIPGFGLGLSLSKRIIQLHKGWISVESTQGVGSTFYIMLPVAGAR
ncbi:MAG: HAMP domain-containing histidine kinase, partial [Bacteroidetes bacterium]|nr:HAMP domain-containing histidine kinase [Bacteroidota bacterium]